MGQMHDATLMSDDFREMDGVVHARFGPLWLGSHFQPIYSVVHGRVVGHEALLRGLDADGHRVSPVEVFAACSGLQDIGRCDTLSRRAHLLNFVKARAQDQWLFLNVHVDAFLHGMEGDMASSKVGWLQGLQVRPEQIVIELLEDSIDRLAPLEQAVQQFKSHGFLIALDDFGAGHSNFDRVWRLKPDIVKLDRSMVVRAAKDAGTARMLGQLTSLLHECGALVLMEGVETYDEALLAMDCDVDLMQGYYFCRPQPMVQTGLSTPDQLTDLYKGMDLRRRAHQRAHKELIAPYVNATGSAWRPAVLPAGCRRSPDWRQRVAARWSVGAACSLSAHERDARGHVGESPLFPPCARCAGQSAGNPPLQNPARAAVVLHGVVTLHTAP
ncbi:EAL domain-containing protein [Aquabacterium sp.]|uniref:EAL domain-containing protein n=1 Tax=Aquabacterium sp. TaxID=1872578 RepID=UPI0035B4B743